MLVKSTVCPFLKLCLRTFGVWPGVSFATVRRLIHLSTTFFLQYFQYRYIIAICMRGEFQGLINSLPATVYYSLTSFKALTMWKHHRIVRELLATMDADWRECVKVDQDLHVMMTKASLSRFCTHFLMTFNISAAILYFGGDNLMAIMQTLQGYNVTSRPFALKLLVPFDAEQSPVYEVVALVLYVHTITMSFVVNTLSSLAITLVFHASGQIEIICQHLKAISEKIYRSPVYTTRTLIERHNRVISFSESIDKLFSYIALLQVFGNTIIICFLGLVLMTSHTTAAVDQVKIIFAYCGISLEIFIFCFLGEHLSLKSRSLGDAGYNSLWYNMSPSYGKNILFIILRSQKQLTITAGRMADLSLEAFTTIMKTSASYMSVLNAKY